MQITEQEPHIPRIELLSEHLIDQIKAGEVIESPANMVKELIENSLDANPTKIILKIKNDPLEFFSISDNGHGIHPDDLPLVFARHATSKIHDYHDLSQLTSYGFRGEALASLGAVAKVQIKSKTMFNSTHLIVHEVGRTEKIQNLNDEFNQSGTEIIVTNLFSSTPVRLKFIQSKLSELQKLKKIIQSYILAYPDITWDLHEDNDFIRYPVNDYALREQQLLSPHLIKKQLEYKNIKIDLWLEEKPSKKRNPLHQFIFINKRPIHFGIAHSIITRNLNFSPAYALFIETHQNSVDVNVHPAKTEVKFLDKASILSIVSTLIQSIITSSSLHIKTKDNTHSVIDENQQQPPVEFYTSTSAKLPTDLWQAAPFFRTQFKHIILLHEELTITYGLKLDKLFTLLLEKTKKNPTTEGFPLLVAKILKVPSSTNDYSSLKYWEAFGLSFRIDKENNLIITSLPDGWFFTNYDQLIQYLCENKNHNDNTFIPKDLSPTLLNPSNLKMLCEFLGSENLKSASILCPLDKLFIHD